MTILKWYDGKNVSLVLIAFRHIGIIILHEPYELHSQLQEAEILKSLSFELYSVEYSIVRDVSMLTSYNINVAPDEQTGDSLELFVHVNRHLF